MNYRAVRMAPRNPRMMSRPTVVSQIVRDPDSQLVKSDVRVVFRGRMMAQARFAYNAKSDRLVFRTPRLPRGNHITRIVATDGDGARTVKAVRIQVR